jgi:hypothetical protein
LAADLSANGADFMALFCLFHFARFFAGICEDACRGFESGDKLGSILILQMLS